MKGRHLLPLENGPEAPGRGFEPVSKFRRTHPAKTHHQPGLVAIDLDELVQLAIGKLMPNAIDELSRCRVLDFESVHNLTILRCPGS